MPSAAIDPPAPAFGYSQNVHKLPSVAPVPTPRRLCLIVLLLLFLSTTSATAASSILTPAERDSVPRADWVLLAERSNATAQVAHALQSAKAGDQATGDKLARIERMMNDSVHQTEEFLRSGAEALVKLTSLARAEGGAPTAGARNGVTACWSLSLSLLLLGIRLFQH